MTKLVIIDGNAILHRAYHALPPLTNKNNEPIQAVFGFASMLLKIIEDLKPQFLAIAFDLPKATFRHLAYVGYKANRPKIADDFVSQIKLVHEMLDQMKLPIFEVAGFEADDVIGTLANQSQKSEVVIATGDHDLLQLVSPTVKVFMPTKGLSEGRLMGEAEVKEKYGIEPAQIVDYKALLGDQADNIPGVNGIGPKTASELIREYGSLENIYSVIITSSKNELKEKTRMALIRDSEKAMLAKELSQINRDVPLVFEKKKCRVDDQTIERIARVLEEFGFKSLVKRVKNSRVGKKGEDETKDEAKDKKEPDRKNQMNLF